MSKNELKYRFENELWPINPMSSKTGSMEGTLTELQYQIASKQLNGSPLDFDTILNKYSQYFDFMQQRNVGVDQKFKSKPLSIQEWLKAEKYREDVSQFVDPRDLYLYGE